MRSQAKIKSASDATEKKLMKCSRLAPLPNRKGSVLSRTIETGGQTCRRLAAEPAGDPPHERDRQPGRTESA